MATTDKSVEEILYDLGRLSETSVFSDNEIQRLIVLLQQAPDDESRALIFKACGSNLPDFLAMAETLRQQGVAFMRLNEAITQLLEKGLLPEAPKQEKHVIETDGRGPPLNPEEIDPVFAEGVRQIHEQQGDPE